MPPAPPPIHTLRTHSAPMASLAFAADNSLIYSGDQDGYLSITDAKTRRALALWKGHESGVLGVQEWDGRLISHGRDNYIHIHHRLPPHRRLSPNTGPGIWKSLSVNALNFCRFALLPLSPADRVAFGTTSSRGYRDQREKENEAVKSGMAGLRVDDAASAEDRSGNGAGEGAAQDNSGQAQRGESHLEQLVVHSKEPERPEKQAEALLAVPNLLDSELCDIYHLPSLRRLHAGINTPPPSTSSGNTGVSVDAEGKNKDRTGLIMALHLGYLPTQVQEKEWERIGAVMSFEDGRVEMWGLPRLETVGDGIEIGAGEGDTGGVRGTDRWAMFSDGSGKVGKRVWERMYEVKGHNEAVMGMAVANDMSAVYTVSADHLLMKHSLAPASITHGNGATVQESTDTTKSSPTPTPAPSTDNPPTACTPDSPTTSTSLRSIGHSSISISPSLTHPILAIGGWDGHVRLFSARTLKSLGTLRYHRDGVQALAFASAPFALRDSRSRSGDRGEKHARSVVGSTIDLDFVSDSASAHTGDSDSDAASTLDERGPGDGARSGTGDSSSGSDTETETPAGKGAGAGRLVRSKGKQGEAPRERWLVSGGKDRRVAIWGLMDFAQAGLGQAG